MQRDVLSLITIVGNKVTDPKSKRGKQYDLASSGGRTVLRNAIEADMEEINQPAVYYTWGDKVYNADSKRFINRSSKTGREFIGRMRNILGRLEEEDVKGARAEKMKAAEEKQRTRFQPMPEFFKETGKGILPLQRTRQLALEGSSTLSVTDIMLRTESGSMQPTTLSLTDQAVLQARLEGRDPAELFATRSVEAGSIPFSGQIAESGVTAEFIGESAGMLDPDRPFLTQAVDEALIGEIDEAAGIGRFTQTEIDEARVDFMRLIDGVNRATGSEELSLVLTVETQTGEILEGVADVAEDIFEARDIRLPKAEAVKLMAIASQKGVAKAASDPATASMPESAKVLKIQMAAGTALEEELDEMIDEAKELEAAAGRLATRSNLPELQFLQPDVLPTLAAATSVLTRQLFGVSPATSMQTLFAASSVWNGIAPILTEIVAGGGANSAAALKALRAGNKVVNLVSQPGAPLAILVGAAAISFMQGLFATSAEIVKESGNTQQKAKLLKQLRKSEIAPPPARGGQTNQSSIAAAYIAQANAEILRAEKEALYNVRANRRSAVTRPLISDQRVMLAGY